MHRSYEGKEKEAAQQGWRRGSYCEKEADEVVLRRSGGFLQGVGGAEPWEKVSWDEGNRLESYKRWPGISAYALNSRLDNALKNPDGARPDKMLLTPNEREDLAEVTSHCRNLTMTLPNIDCRRQCDKLHWQGIR